MFDNSIVLISGAIGGMGSSHARAFHAAGARVVLGDVRDSDGQALAADLGERALFVHLDVTSEESWRSAIQKAETTFGPITILINNAGVQHAPGLVTETDLATWERTLAINVTGQFLGIKHTVPSIRRGGGGAIVNIGSTTGLGATGYYAPYAASKWAVRGLTQTAAAELGQHDIRVNCVHPGVVATPFTTEPAAPGAPVLAEVFSPEPYAIARLAQPEDVTRTVVFLASDDAAFTTGAEYVVDGGLTLGPAVRS